MLQPNQILHQRYQLYKKLGSNPTHQTWLARDLDASSVTDSLVVVKLLALAGDAGWDELKLFERETKILRQLNHPYLPKYRDYFSLDAELLWFGLVTEYIEGKSLKESLDEGKIFSETEARLLGEQVLVILSYLHQLNPPVLHRDIKPSNLILSKDNKIYLIDFGSVQDRAAAEGATFTVVGTYGYTPLEQFGGRANFSSDLYALGATLIHLITGVAPADLVREDSQIHFAELVRVNPGFIRWLEQMTQTSPQKRFKTAKQALESLRKNNIASGYLTGTKPKNSRIILKKSPRKLEIQIPSARFGFGELLALMFIFIGFIFPSFNQPWWISLSSLGASFLFIGWWLVPDYRKIYVDFDPQHFVIKWKLFSLVSRQWHNQIVDIDEVVFQERIFGKRNVYMSLINFIISGISDPSKAENNQDPMPEVFPAVTIIVGTKEYPITVFNPPLTEAECKWLVQEIESWLGLK